MKKTCPTCKKEFEKNYNYSKKYWEKQKYCSIKCSNTLIKKGSIPYNKGKKGLWGSDSPTWRGGRSKTVNGYVRVLIPGTGSHQLEHRMIMEKHLGRKLGRKEQVHHINGIKDDNRLENLQVLDIRGHGRLHRKQQLWETSGSK